MEKLKVFFLVLDIVIVITEVCIFHMVAKADEMMVQDQSSLLESVMYENQPVLEIIPGIEEPVEVYPSKLPDVPLGYRRYIPTDVPIEVWLAAVKWGMIYDLSPNFLSAIGWKETRWLNVKSKSGLYWGVMQIHPDSHKRRMEKLGVTDLMDIDQNMHVAADYLRELLDEENDSAIALMRYHGEPQSNITRYLSSGKMSSYAATILKLSEELEEKHEAEMEEGGFLE